MNDDVIKSEFHYHAPDNTMTHITTQPTENIILQRNAELRKNPGALNDLSFGRQVASVPEIMFWKAVRDGYQLNAPDSKIAGQEMMRYLKSEEGRKCLVQAPKEGRGTWQL
jgi:hypothetical protein